ncbi:MAG: hypothetical protein QM762_08815 [Chryseolinea sp.]
MEKSSKASGMLAAPKKDTSERWQAESDLRTLMEAKTIQKDTKRLAAAQAVAREQMSGHKDVIAQTPDTDADGC